MTAPAPGGTATAGAPASSGAAAPTAPALTHGDILRWLRQTDPAALEPLWQQADAVRRAHVGDQVHLRGLIEISNHCVRLCGYCGLRGGNTHIERYRMTEDEILSCAREALTYGWGTTVLQAGEDPGLTREFIAGVSAQPRVINLRHRRMPVQELGNFRRAAGLLLDPEIERPHSA